MKFNFLNKHIFWCMEPVWYRTDFPYKFKIHINQLVAANPDNEFEQEVEIGKDILLTIYKAVSSQYEGVSAAINKSIKDVLLPQLSALSNNDIDNPNEAFATLLGIQELDQADTAAREKLIQKGKDKILEQ